MANIIDSHAHLDDKAYDSDRETLIASLQENNLQNVITIGADIPSSKAAVALAEKYPFIYSAIGVHPYDAAKFSDVDMKTLETLSESKKVVAIGEIGLDYHMDTLDKEAQQKCFIKQLQLATKLNLPVIIHDRDAHMDSLNIIKEHFNGKGVFHCYAGSVEMAKELINLGFYISFTGVCSFKNAKTVKEVVKYVPNDRFLIETDCPYLSPEPHRGTRSSPLNLHIIAETIANLKEISYETACNYATQNTLNLFNID